MLCFPVLARGGEIVIMRAPDVGQFIANIERSSLPCFWYGAAPMSVARLEEALTRIGPVMAQLFGQTEAPMMISTLSPSQHFNATRPIQGGQDPQDRDQGPVARPELGRLAR
jgi:fatty-acyl-CoA synthase